MGEKVKIRPFEAAKVPTCEQDRGFDYYYDKLRDDNPEELRVLLKTRTKAVHLGNMSTYDEKQKSFRGYAQLTSDGVFYYQCNLVPLVIIPGEIDYLSRQKEIDREDMGKVLSSLDWLHHNQSIDIGPGITGVFENQEGGNKQAWVKYSAEKAIAEARIYQFLTRMTWPDQETKLYKERAISHAEFLAEAAEHSFAVKYDAAGGWINNGWLSYGRAVRALNEVFKITNDNRYREFAIKYGDKLIETLIDLNGPYFRNEEGVPCFDSDIIADPIKGLIQCHNLSGDKQYLYEAMKLKEWLIVKQLKDGAYPLRIFQDPELNKATPRLEQLRTILEGRTESGSALNLVGIASPGDVANITISLIELWEATGKPSDIIPPINKGLAYCLYTQNMDKTSPVFGLSPSWRPTIGKLSPSWSSVDSTYSGDQGGLIEQMYLMYIDKLFG
ncbi:hypothetical protein KKE48_04465 [Patescibacteria group bacterium]|nr:hypothetical protein [Patescibacteria group bacterium]